MKKKGFHNWAWLVVMLLGGLLMIYGGAQDLTLFFSPESDLAPVPSWHTVPPIAGLICGLIVLASAVLNLVWGWQLKSAKRSRERKLSLFVILGSSIGIIADWISGYYGFGSLAAMLTGLWLIHNQHNVLQQ